MGMDEEKDLEGKDGVSHFHLIRPAATSSSISLIIPLNFSSLSMGVHACVHVVVHKF